MKAKLKATKPSKAIRTFASVDAFAGALEERALKMNKLARPQIKAAVRFAVKAYANEHDNVVARASMLPIMVSMFGVGKAGKPAKPKWAVWKAVTGLYRPVHEYSYRVLIYLGKQVWGDLPNAGAARTSKGRGAGPKRALARLDAKLANVIGWDAAALKQDIPLALFNDWLRLAQAAATLRKAVEAERKLLTESEAESKTA